MVLFRSVTIGNFGHGVWRICRVGRESEERPCTHHQEVVAIVMWLEGLSQYLRVLEEKLRECEQALEADLAAAERRAQLRVVS